ncbi:hypothetical protein LRS74_06425 [Streptomyces sp. LX-29]|uniref:hypothetical protein n=1 Tax=Streptomyces sp. LX-29 TaxID=2900152 RepID=UPI00240DAB6E|nr:hypothetical protein [Streptomyces sp. LX-29]WFB06719.1 hypothetical protein LRS74_06425 [Streptomyces sp. LX-29]
MVPLPVPAAEGAEPGRGADGAEPGAGENAGAPAGGVRAAPRLAAVPAPAARGRRALPWALMVGTAAAVVLGITAAEVRPNTSEGDGATRAGRPAPSASATPRTGGAPSPEPPSPSAATTSPEPERRPAQGVRKAEEPPERGRDGGRSTYAPPARPSGGSGAGGSGGTSGRGTPLAVTTRSHVWENGCDHRYLIDRPPAEVAPPPVEQDAAPWAATHHAVHGGSTSVEVTVQGRSDTAVVLQDLHVRVVGRRPPPAWSSYAMSNGCGDAITPRAFSVDLDADRPRPKPEDGFDGERTIPAVRFPYRVSATDPEVLRVDARTSGCDCRWYLELDWTSGDRKGTIRIDDGGVPFRTSGVEGRPEYGYWLDRRAWVRNTD